MDPNETLRRIRAAVEAYYQGTDEDAAEVMADAFEALDGWLSKGGFPPSAWQPGVGEIDPDYVLDRIVPLGPPDPAHGELPVEHGLDWHDQGNHYTGTCECPKGWTYTAMSMDELLAMYEIHLRKEGVPDHRLPYCLDCLQPRTPHADRHCRATSTRTDRTYHRWSNA